MMRVLRSILLVVLIGLMLVFVLQNSSELVRPVEIKLDLFLKDLSPGPVPQYGLVLGALLAGILIGGIWGLLQQLGLRSRLRETKKLLKERESELDSLRNLPVVETSSLPVGSQSGQGSGSTGLGK